MSKFDFDFRTRTPNPPLGRAVASIWYARGTVPYRRERIAPTGSTVAVFVLGDPIIETAMGGPTLPLVADQGFLIGPHDRPVMNEPTGETFAVGIVTTAIGCRAVFGLGPAGIAGRVVQLTDAWPPAVGIRAELLRLGDPEAMLDVLTGHLTSHLDLSDPGLDRCEQAVEMVGDDPKRPISSVGRSLGMSHGHLDREFTRIVGISPRRYSRLRRVQRLLAGIDVRGNVAWAGLAAELGWFDQSHLIRDVRRHTGVTPSGYLAARRAWTSPEDTAEAAMFVPESM